MPSLFEKIYTQKDTYIYSPYYELYLRTELLDDGHTKSFIKPVGKDEHEATKGAGRITDILMSGFEVTKDVYDAGEDIDESGEVAEEAPMNQDAPTEVPAMEESQEIAQ